MGHALLQWLRPVTTPTGNMCLQRIHVLLTDPGKLYAEINSLKDIHLKVIGALDLRTELDRVFGEGMYFLPTQSDSGVWPLFKCQHVMPSPSLRMKMPAALQHGLARW